MVQKGIIGVKAGCKVKICGVTNVEDARLAAGEGADYLGVVVNTAFSPRSLSVEEAGPIFAAVEVPVVVLVYDLESEGIEQVARKLNPFAIQFLSPEGPALAGFLKSFRPKLKIWQSLYLPAGGTRGGIFDAESCRLKVEECKKAGIDAVLFDTVAVVNGVARFGGTGLSGDWEAAAHLVQESPLPSFLAGGIEPGNVKRAIETVRPFGIDLCSGVEEYPGKKSPSKIRALLEEVKRAV